MKPIETERLILRNWQDSDRALFHEVNADEAVMEFFEFRMSREESDAKMDEWRDKIARDGFGFAAATLKSTGETIGMVGIAKTDSVPHYDPGAHDIGWRFSRRFWGAGYAPEGARAWLRHGFTAMGLDDIVAMAVRDNHRSTRVMEKIGMHYLEGCDFDHPHVPDTAPALKPHVLYGLKRVEWAARQD